MRFLLSLMMAVALALGLGAWSAKRVLDSGIGAGYVRLGAWVADPLAGSVDADPYEKARLSRLGDLTLGVGEGVQFRTVRDSAGRFLRRDCSYMLAGDLPLARVWTLSPFTPDGRLIHPGDGRPGWLVSRSLLRSDDNSVRIAVGPTARPGNWLSLTGKGDFALVLTLYDTPASTSSGLGHAELLSIERTGCTDA